MRIYRLATRAFATSMALLLVAGVTVGMFGAPAGAASTGGITGSVTTAAGGTGLAGICVTATGVTLSQVGTATTAANGSYTITGLQPDSYTVEFATGCGAAADYLTQWYNDEPSQSFADYVPVTAGAPISGIDAAMSLEGGISGVVTAAVGGAPLSGICVTATDQINFQTYNATTGSTGAYTMTGLTAGDQVDVEFEVNGCGNTTDYVPQWYDNKSSDVTADPVTVPVGTNATGINAAMVLGATIQGKVTAAADGTAQAGICVSVQDINDSSNYFAATTASDGTYSVNTLPAGSYQVSFSTGCGNSGTFIEQYYSGAYSSSSATAVTVNVGQTVNNINAAMTPGGTINGTVTAAVGGSLAGICVTATPIGGGFGAGQAVTSSTGTYSVTGLLPGSYSVDFAPGCGTAPQNVLEQWYNDRADVAAADPVTVTATSTAQNINAVMLAGGTISGTVTAATGGTQLAGVCVSAISNGTLTGGTATTTSTGSYSIVGLASGQYRIEFSTGSDCATSPGNYVTQYYNDEAALSTGDLVSVTAGSTTNSINAALATGATIKGTVTAAVGATAVAGACVDAYSGGLLVGSATTLSTGAYSITGLPAGPYQVEFMADGTCGGLNYLTQWYNGAASMQSATAVVVAAGGTKSAINAAMAAGGSISGKASTSGTGTPGVCVDAYPYNSTTIVGTAITGSTGTYTISGLPSGNYAVQFSAGCGSANNFPTVWYNGKSSETASTVVQVTAGSTTTGIGASLAAGGTINGTVTAAVGGAPLAGVCVEAFLINGLESAGIVTTGANGTYSMTGVPPGSYHVEFFTGSDCFTAGNYVTQWYNGAGDNSSATAVKVTAGTATNGINAAMQTSGSISGTVTAAAGGLPVEGACVNAFASGVDASSGFPAATATTANDGTYELEGLAPGSYTVNFETGGGTYGCGNSQLVGQWYNGKATQGSATTVTVTAGSSTTGINAALQAGGSVSGVVTAAAGGADLAGICVDLWEQGVFSPVPAGSAVTASDGSYSIAGLGTGTYSVDFYPGCGNTGDFLEQWYDNQPTGDSATPVSVTIGSPVTGVNAALVLGGSITGTVTDQVTGDPLGGICVAVYTQFGDTAGLTTTAGDGTYTVSTLPSGSYAVEFSNCNDPDVLSQWYNAETSAGSADFVSVTAGTTTSGINAVLPNSGAISGVVTGPGSQPAANVCVVATNTTNSSLSGSGTTDSAGKYVITGLPAGPYQVEFAPPGSFCTNQAFVPLWYNQATTQSAASTVTVSAGTTAGSVNASLSTGGSIAGTVTVAGSGTDLAGICVSATESSGPGSASSTTEANGTYTLSGLPAGSYSVEFFTDFGCGASGTYLDQWYNGQPNAQSATPVTVTAGTQQSGINAAMQAGGSITGTVTAASAPVANECVTATGTNGTASDFTGADGTYTLTGLPAGSYTVEFTSCGVFGAEYAPQWYNGASSQSASTPVSVTLGTSTSSINASLTAGASISGTVTADGTDAAGVAVFAYSTTDPADFAASAITASDGTYQLEGLLPGSYTVEFEPADPTYATQWYSGQVEQQNAIPLTVTTGDVSGIDASLVGVGSISGTVTDASTHKGIDGICVTASSGSGANASVGTAQTFVDGKYTISDLTPGPYTVEFSTGCGAPSGYAPQWANDQSSLGSANTLTVTSGSTTDADAALTSGTLAAPAFTSDSPPLTAESGQPYSYGFVATGNPAPDYSLVSAPSWLTISSATGELMGMPPSGTSSFSYSVQASNGQGAPVTAGPFTVTVTPTTATTTSVSVHPTSSTVDSSVTYDATVSSTSGTPAGTVTFSIGTVQLCAGTLSGGTTSCSSTAAPAGSDTVTAVYGGDTTHAVSYGTTSLTVAKMTSTVVVGVTPSSTNFDSNVTYSATVSPSSGGVPPLGTVTFSINGVTMCSSPFSISIIGSTVTVGPATCTSSAAPVGTDTVTASYSGDNNFSASTGHTTLTVLPGPAITSTSPLSPGAVGAAYSDTLGATGGTTPYTWTVSSGSLPPGLSLDAATGIISGTPQSAVTASFTVTLTDNASLVTSVPFELEIGQGAASVVASAPATSTFGQTQMYSATVTGDGVTPSGTVTFSVGSKALCVTGALSGGAGSCTSSFAPGGTDTVTATYSGDANYYESTGTTSIDVTSASSSTTASVNPTTTTQGSTVTYSATVSSAAGTPTGSVSFAIGAGPVLCTATLNGGSGSCTSTGAGLGSPDVVTASYLGDGNFAPSSGNTDLTITPGPLVITNTTLSAGVVGQTYSDSVAVTGGVPSYTWAVSSGTLPSGLSLDTATGAITGTPQSTGSFPFTVTVTDSDSPVASTPQSYTVTVGPGTPTVSVTVSPTSITFGDTVAYTATVAGGGVAPTGTVTFSVGSTTLCTAVPLSSGTADCSSSLAPGNVETVTASYSGDGNYNTGSGTKMFYVTAAPTTVTASATPTSVMQGAEVTLATTVSSTVGTPAGSVRFTVGNTVLCVATLSAGSGSCTSGAAPVGSPDTVTATYLGDGSGDYAGNFATTTLTVNPPPTHGYWLVAGDGGIFTFGKAKFFGSTGNLHLQRPVVGMTPTADRQGYWMVATDGGMFAFGDAKYHGSIPGLGLHPAGSGIAPELAAPIVAMVASPDGKGYLMVASDGGVFAFGDALFHGSCPGIGGCNGSVVAVVPDAGELGYWVVTSTGHVYAFGNAASVASGQPGTTPAPITGATASATGHGYLIVDAKGDVYDYGDAHKYGSPPGGVVVPGSQIVGLVPTSTGNGYWLVGAAGAVYWYGDAVNDGSMAGKPLNAPIVTAAGF